MDATLLANNSQHCQMLHVVSAACCCAKFETGQTFSYLQTNRATPNNVASVCTWCNTDTPATRLLESLSQVMDFGIFTKTSNSLWCNVSVFCQMNRLDAPFLLEWLQY